MYASTDPSFSLDECSTYTPGEANKSTPDRNDLCTTSNNTKFQMTQEEDLVELVKEFSTLNSEAQKHYTERRGAPYIVLLTGATGALGAHILDTLRKSPLTSQVICLVRAVDHFAARSRVSASLVKRKKAALDISDPKVWCSPCNLGAPNLGLSEIELSHIRQSTTHIIHAAWAINFTLPLKTFFAEHISGIQNLLGLTHSCSNAVQFTFCSSTESVVGSSQDLIKEEVSKLPSDAGLTGYAKSKWVAEAVCAMASLALSLPVNILRIGQLTGDTKNGIWNISEAWPLLLTTVDVLDCLPQIDEHLDWLPLDTAGIAIVDIAFDVSNSDKSPNVYHLVNTPSIEVTWSNLLAWSKDTRSKPFDIVSPRVWLDRLESYPTKHPAKNLLGVWKKAYENDNNSNTSRHTPLFSIVEAQKKSNVMRKTQPVDQELVKKIWSWLEDEIKSAKEHVYVSRNRFDCV